MSTFGNQDIILSVPKFSLERTVRPIVTLAANANTTSLSNTINFSDVSQIQVGMYVSGNNINQSSVLPGFFNANVTVTAVNTTSQTITISSNILANVFIGDGFEFDNTISYRSHQGYFPDTYLVTPSRIANATFGDANNPAITHAGWVRITEGTGGVDSISIATAGNGYANGYVQFAGNTSGSGANASYTVDANGIINVILLHNGGSGYNVAPTASILNQANASNNAVLTVTMNGRAGRIFTETLVALSNCVASNANSGGIYFTGV